MSDELLREMLQQRNNRLRYGPICGLCRHSTFTPRDYPNLVVPYQTGPNNETFRVERCKEINLNITATSGKDCRHYTRDGAKE